MAELAAVVLLKRLPCACHACIATSALQIRLDKETLYETFAEHYPWLTRLGSNSHHLHPFVITFGHPPIGAAVNGSSPAIQATGPYPEPSTNTPVGSPTPGPSPTSTPTIVAYPPPATPTDAAYPPPATSTPTPVSSTRIKDITFENNSLTDPVTGADGVATPVALDGTTPLKGAYSARVSNTSTGNLYENFTAVDELYISFYIKLTSIGGSSARIAQISNSGTTVGNLVLSSSGTLQLRNNSTSIGSVSSALTVGTLYRVGLHQKKGTGANAVLEAFLATGDTVFGSPFASGTTQTFTSQANKFIFGATNSTVVNAAFDDIRLDSASIPPPSTGMLLRMPQSTSGLTPNPTVTLGTSEQLSGLSNVVYSESSPDKITVWVANADKPDLRRALLTVDRYGGAGIQANLSHDGKKLAYTAFPPGATGSDFFTADLWVVDLSNPQPRKLASHVDIGRYLNYPLWSPDGNSIAFYRQIGKQYPIAQEIAIVDVQTGQETTLSRVSITTPTEDVQRSVYPIDWSPDGRYLYYRQGTAGHVELWRVDRTPGNTTNYINTISEQGYSGCFFFSPDGQDLLCTLIQRDSSQNAVTLVPVGPGKARNLVSGISQYTPAPIWNPRERQVTLRQPVQAGQRTTVAMLDSKSGASNPIVLAGQGDIVPLSWSPDGQWLAAYTSPERQGNLMVVSRDGAKVQSVSTSSGLIVIGWISGDISVYGN